VNDGSTDSSEFISAEWCKRDTRFICLKKENGGLSSARNAGLKIASGEFIQFLDADDLITPDKFSTQVYDLQIAAKYSVSVSDYLPFSDETGEFVPQRYLTPFLDPDNFMKEIIRDWETKKSIPCHSFLFPSHLIKKDNLLFDEELPNHEDWLFWCQVLFNARQIVYSKKKLALYRIRSNSMCTDLNLMNKGFYQAAKSIKSFLLNNNSDRHTMEMINEKIEEIENKLGIQEQNVKTQNFRSNWVNSIFKIFSK
jgi:glycosyltransferase involved in cell wall biosynthesis